jgi:hypothetical protein
VWQEFFLQHYNLKCREAYQILACQSIPSWNRIIRWLKEVETVRQCYLNGSKPHECCLALVSISPAVYSNSSISLLTANLLLLS